jgi:hypothetical protein
VTVHMFKHATAHDAQTDDCDFDCHASVPFSNTLRFMCSVYCASRETPDVTSCLASGHKKLYYLPFPVQETERQCDR